MNRWLYISLFVCLLSVSFSALSFPADYDRHFKSASSMYLPGVDWKLLKAQCWQESRFREDAVSPVGAQGICQFMPGTWSDVSKQLGISESAFNTRWNIYAAAYYMSGLRRQWSAPRPEYDRHSLAMASYNAGLGHLLEAQRRCDDSAYYGCIIECLPSVTGHHSKETIDYVESIWGFWFEMRI